MAENLNKYFTKICPNQASKVPNKQGHFEKLIKVQANIFQCKVYIPWPEEFFPKKRKLYE